jgi:outer membrane protein assembly factor BamB
LELSSASGQPKVKWKFQTTGNSYGPPLIYDGVAYFGDEGGFMHAVNVKDGSEKWRYQLQGKIWSSPTIKDRFDTLVLLKAA